ncbi:MAG: class I SAM-dependent methyltransferase [Thermoplasmata archaeon]
MRYEGTAQRDLFRALRERFVLRHPSASSWVLDAGSGPGRFTPILGGHRGVRPVALDIGREMLRELWEHRAELAPNSPAPHRVLADAFRPPFAAERFGLVAALGNLLGSAGADTPRLLDSLTTLVGPGGSLLLEIAPGPGERSRYLHRLPPGSVARLLRVPPRAAVPRIAREGYVADPPRRTREGAFRRVDPTELRAWLEARGFRVRETVAVAPALGPDEARLDAVGRDPKAWGNLLEVEEVLGRSPERWGSAAAVLVAAERPRPDEEAPNAPVAESEG